MENIIFTMLLLVPFVKEVLCQKIPITSSSNQAIEYYNRGWEQENLLKEDNAKKYYQRAISIDSTFALAYLRLAMINPSREQRGKLLKKAVEYSKNSTEGEKQWIMGRFDFYGAGNEGLNEYNYFKQLVEGYPNDEVANFLFGFINVNHGRNDHKIAIKYYRKAIEINPDYAAPYNELVYSYAALRDFTNAQLFAQKYINLIPNASNPHDTYAELLMTTGQYKKSIKAYKKVLDIDSEYPWAIMGIAANYNFLGQHVKARKFLKRLKEEKLSDYEYRHLWRSEIVSYLDEGNIAAALKLLENQKQASLKQVNKREPLFHIYYAFLRKTRLYFENNDPDYGLKEYYAWNTFVEKNFENKNTKARVKNLEFYYLAYQSYLNHQLSKAQDFIDQFEKVNGKKTDRSINLSAKIYLKQKEYSMAINLLKQTDLDNPYNQYWLALAFLKKGDLAASNIWKKKVCNANKRNNIDLALVRKKAKHL